MTCVHKEYKIKRKMVQKHWLQLKMKFLLGYDMRLSSPGVCVCVGGGYEYIFCWWKGFSPHPPSRETSVKLVQMNIYQSNTYRKNLKWLPFGNEPKVQERQQVKNQ